MEKRPYPQSVLGFLNLYILRFIWMRISWQEPNTPEEEAKYGKEGIIPGTFKFHFPVRPSWLMEKS
jgi:hypothetical protein